MHLVDDKHLVSAYLRRYVGLLHEGLYALHRVVGSGVELKDIVGALLVESLAALTLVAGLALGSGVLAVYCLGKDAGTGGLSHPSRAAEEVCVGQFAGAHSVLQRCGERRLSHHRVEAHGAVLTRRNYIFHVFNL